MSYDQTQTIGPGSEVVMHYTITLEDGTVADTSDGGEPLRAVIGDGSLIQGLELALIGLRAGQHECVSISPDQAFGFRDPAHVHTLSRADFTMDIAPGMVMSFTLPSGEEVVGGIVSIEDDVVTVDFNHPMAGHEITFEAEIISVKNP